MKIKLFLTQFCVNFLGSLCYLNLRSTNTNIKCLHALFTKELNPFWEKSLPSTNCAEKKNALTVPLKKNFVASEKSCKVY